MNEQNTEKSQTESSTDETPKTVEFAVWNFFFINFICFLIPLYFCLGLFLVFEYFFIKFFAIPTIIHFILLPGFFLLLYYIYLIILIEFSALWTRRWIKKSPPVQGVFKRVLKKKSNDDDETSKIIDYYHKRGYIIKYPMWLTSKSPFPWLINRTLRRIGHNKIGKNVIYCDAYAGLEFTDIGDNTFMYPSTVLSSHAVNSIFGKLSIFEIKLGENNVLHGTVVGPGAKTEENNEFYPGTVLPKNWRGVPGEVKYQGTPGYPLKKK